MNIMQVMFRDEANVKTSEYGGDTAQDPNTTVVPIRLECSHLTDIVSH